MKTLLDKEELVFNPPELGCVLSLPEFPGGGSRIYDRSPYGNIGTITGAGWQRLPGGLWCLSFDGTDDYVNCGNKSSLDITGAITLETWVKVTDDTKQFPKIIAKYETYELYLHAATMKVRGTFYTAGGVVDKYGTQVLVQDAWYYLVITYDSTTMHPT